jgi:hypothetical protein
MDWLNLSKTYWTFYSFFWWTLIHPRQNLSQSTLGGGGHRVLGRGEGTRFDLFAHLFCRRVHYEWLAVIVNWEGERGLGLTCSVPSFLTERAKRGLWWSCARRKRGDWVWPVLSLTLPQGVLGGVSSSIADPDLDLFSRIQIFRPGSSHL